MIKLLFCIIQFILVCLVVVKLKNNRDYDCFERYGRSIVYITLWNIGIAMLLSILGFYSMYALGAVDLLLGIALFISGLMKKESVGDVFFDVHELLRYKHIIIIFVGIAVLYAAFPTNYMLGGRDPGLYYLNGIHVAQTGSYQYEEDVYLTEHYEELEGVVTPGYAGIYSDYEYGYSEQAGSLTPQFMPMYASAMAIGYDLGGIALMIRVNSWIAMLSFMMIYFFLKRNFSEKVGVVSVILLSVSPAQLWYGRNSVSELLLQLLIFVSVDLFAQGFKQQKASYGIASGLILGIGAMDRIDAYILGVGLIAILLYAIFFSPDKQKYACCSVLAYCITGVAAFLYGIIWSRPYFYDHMKNNGSLTKILCFNLVLLLLTVILYLVQKFLKKRKKAIQKNYFCELFNHKKAVIIILVLLLLVWSYAYAVRPLGVSTEDATYFMKHNIAELSWYISPVIMVFSILGLVGILYKMAEEREPVFLFLAIGLSNYIGYGINPYISKDHIWAARRWVTIIIPFLMIMGVLGIQVLYHWLQKRNALIGLIGKIICSCMILGVLGFLVYQSKAFIVTKIMNNLDTQIEALAEQLVDDQLYITDNEEVASYLHYVYNKQVYYSTLEDTEAIEQYIKDNQELNYIGNYASIEGLECEKKLIQFYETKGWFLEKVIGEYPRKLYERTREASIYQLVSLTE